MTALRGIGLISGTSADGIDAALVELSGTGHETRVRLVAERTVPYAEDLRARVLALAGGEPASAAEFAGLHALVGEVFAGAARAVLEAAGLTPEEAHFIGSHGQTIAHAPAVSTALARPSTWQIGDPAVIAERTGLPVVSDFRARDIAAGGEGAPLVPLLDFLLLRSAEKARAALNVGGVANVTFLPRACALEDVVAFDTGPGNAIADELAAIASNGGDRYDAGGRLAARGRPDDALMGSILSDPFFARRPPRSTGRDAFGREAARALWRTGSERGLSPADIVASAVAVTAWSIADALRQWYPGRLEELIVSGGGVHNRTLMEMLAANLPGIRVARSDDYGLPVDAKEAIAFAVLANETLHGRPGNVPAATGAARPVVLGSVTPGRGAWALPRIQVPA